MGLSRQRWEQCGAAELQPEPILLPCFGLQSLEGSFNLRQVFRRRVAAFSCALNPPQSTVLFRGFFPSQLGGTVLK